jgi:transcriptional regulator with XRE-family HTH domain
MRLLPDIRGALLDSPLQAGSMDFMGGHAAVATGGKVSATLGTIIKDACAEKGWSLRELARRAKLPAATVQKITSTPGIVARVDNLQKIARALGLPVTVLLEAAARDSGYTTTPAHTGEIDVIVASLNELSPQRLHEVQALVEAMLSAEKPLNR